MVTKTETGKLQLSMLRYAAMLLLIIGLAWVGVSSEDSGDGGVSSPTARAAVTPAGHDSAVVEEKPGRDVEAYPDLCFENPERITLSDGGYFYYGIPCYTD